MAAAHPNWQNTGGSGGFGTADHDTTQIYNYPNGCDAVILGASSVMSRWGATWNLNHRQGQALTFAPNRKGKGATCIIPALLTYGGSVFTIDPKGENCWVTAQHRRTMGQRVITLDPWGEVNRRYAEGNQPENGTRFNPLSFLDPASRSFAEDVQAVADALIVTTPGEHPHWPDSAREFVSGLIALAVESQRTGGKRATLRHVRFLMTARPSEILDAIDLVKKHMPNSLAYRKLRRFTTETDEMESVRSTANTQMGFLDSDDLMDSMEPKTGEPEFNLEDFANHPTTIYVVLPVDKLVTHVRWLRLITNLVIRALTRLPRPPAIPALLLIDEMGTIGPLRTLENSYSLFAGLGVRCWGFYQSITQLQADYPTRWQNFIGNCSILQLLAATDMETANYFSQMLGTTTIRENKQQYNARLAQYIGSTTPGPMLPPQVTGSRPVMFPQEIQNMLGKYPDRLEQNQQLIIFTGEANVLQFQHPYFAEAKWQGKYRPIPWLKPYPQFAGGGGTSLNLDAQTKKTLRWISIGVGGLSLFLLLFTGFGGPLFWLMVLLGGAGIFFTRGKANA